MKQNLQENPNLFEKPHNPSEVTTIKAKNSKKTKKNKKKQTHNSSQPRPKLYHSK